MKKYILKNWNSLIIAIISRVVFCLSWVFVSIVIQNLVDTAINGNRKLFLNTAIFSIVYFIGLSLINYFNEYTKAAYLKKTLTFLKKDIFKSIINKSYSDFNSKNSSEYISNLTNDLKSIEDNYFSSIIDIVENIFIFIFTLTLLIYINIYVTLVLCLVGTFMLLVPYVWGKYIQNSENDLSNSFTNFTNKIKDILGGYEIIKSYNVESSYIDKFNMANKDLEYKKYRNRIIIGKADCLSLFLSLACQFSGVIVAGFFVINKTLTPGVLIAILQLGNGIFGPIEKITHNITSIRSMKGITRKLLNLIDESEEIHSSDLVNFNNSIEVKNLIFSYENSKNIINNVSYKFNKNKKYMILGESGCGKTTFIKTILGYYKNYLGDIILDDISLKNNTFNLADISATIHQSIYMFNESIKTNICLDKEFSDLDINKALTISGIKDFIDSLDNGIETIISENGSNLSGGQKQRISIARAIIQKKPILFLDESTSSLDAKTAYDIESLLLDMNDITIITITHNLNDELMKKYDEILFMKNGKIVESGNFNELIENKGEFYELYKIKEVNKVS